MFLRAIYAHDYLSVGYRSYCHDDRLSESLHRMIIDSTQSEIYTVKNQDMSMAHRVIVLFSVKNSVTVECRKFEVLGTRVFFFEVSKIRIIER